ncbi:MAG: peptidase P60, partial [Desulfovibrio sp.]|nr:peptidase P60 [Desulfovibrio sp.]
MSRHARVLGLLCLVLAIALLASCSGKKHPRPVPAAPGEIADLRNFPQDLNAYAKGSRKPLMDPATQASQAARWQSRFFSPWHMSQPSVGRKEASTLLNARARGWKDGYSRWTEEEWAGMRANADMAS